MSVRMGLGLGKAPAPIPIRAHLMRSCTQPLLLLLCVLRLRLQGLLALLLLRAARAELLEAVA